jgi:hypothetical protein
VSGLLAIGLATRVGGLGLELCACGPRETHHMRMHSMRDSALWAGARNVGSRIMIILSQLKL